MKSPFEVLKSRLADALVAAFGEDGAVDPALFPATNPKFGDYQSNVALSLTKQLGKPPRVVAEEIVKYIQVEDICQAPEIAGPGFINLTLRQEYLEARLTEALNDPRLGVPKAEHPKRIVIDFSSPNIAKEMHVGHLRSTIIGDCLAHILEFQGQDVLRLNHVGDWGTQFGMLIAYLREAYPTALTTSDALDLGDLVALYRKAKHRFDEDEAFAETSRQEVVRLQSGNPDSLRAWNLLCDQSRRAFALIYDTLDVELTERGESFYNSHLAAVVEDLEAQGLLTTSDGAKCVFPEGFKGKSGDPQPVIIQKSDGGFNYATTDLAALRYRINEDKAKDIIYVTDAGQANHFAMVFAVARMAHWIPDDVALIHVPFGLVLGEDNKKLKTRSGETVRLADLLTESVEHSGQMLSTRLEEEGRVESAEWIADVAKTVGIAAVKYTDLSQNRLSDYVFSYDKMLALQGNTAPYMLYAYARIQGISRKGKADGNQPSGAIHLEHEAEIALAKHLLQLSEQLDLVCRDLLPNRLCNYLFELSQKFNLFYEHCPVLSAAPTLQASRLALCELTANTLKLGLSLLGIPVLNRM